MTDQHRHSQLERVVAIHDHTLFGRNGTNGLSGKVNQISRRVAALERSSDHTQQELRDRRSYIDEHNIRLTRMERLPIKLLLWITGAMVTMISGLITALWKTGFFTV